MTAKRSRPDSNAAPGDREVPLEVVEERLGYRFRDPELLRTALTHVSFANETMRDPGASYERLEFLGDALLGFLVARLLVAADPDADEGLLTRRKQIVVQTDALADAARSLGLGDALRLSRGETATGGREKPSLLADVFEAVLGAVYLDRGVRSARAMVRRCLRDVLRIAARSEQVGRDFKTRLQERVQGELRVTPTYRIVSRSGPDHEREFRAEVRIERRVVGTGTGKSRKRAEQAAAEAALASMGPGEHEEGER
jgi:ribonuclease-3